MITNFDKAIELALRTWYPVDDPLHLNPHHPLGKLCGEWGEVKEDCMKVLYKPQYQSELERELGDVWYYLRILCYQNSYTPEPYILPSRKNTEYLIAYAAVEANNAFMDFMDFGEYFVLILDISYAVLLEILKRHDITLEQLTALNWQKLKPGSTRGDEWMKERT